MALDPDAFRNDQKSQTLGTGFTYQPQSEVDGFQFRPEVLSELTGRMSELEKHYRQPPTTDYLLLR